MDYATGLSDNKDAFYAQLAANRRTIDSMSQTGSRTPPPVLPNRGPGSLRNAFDRDSSLRSTVEARDVAELGTLPAQERLWALQTLADSDRGAQYMGLKLLKVKALPVLKLAASTGALKEVISHYQDYRESCWRPLGLFPVCFEMPMGTDPKLRTQLITRIATEADASLAAQIIADKGYPADLRGLVSARQASKAAARTP